MHSNRIGTFRCSSRLPGGMSTQGEGRLPRGVRLEGGVCPGGVCLEGVSARGVYTTTPRGQTDTCENITFPQLLLRLVNIKRYSYGDCQKFLLTVKDPNGLFTLPETDSGTDSVSDSKPELLDCTVQTMFTLRRLRIGFQSGLTWVRGLCGGAFSTQSPNSPVTRLQMNAFGLLGDRRMMMSPLQVRYTYVESLGRFTDLCLNRRFFLYSTNAETICNKKVFQ